MSPNDSNQEEKPKNRAEPVETSSDSSPAFIAPPVSNSSESTKKEFESKEEKIDFQEKKDDKMSEFSNGMQDIFDYMKQNKEALITYLFLLTGLLFLVLGDFFLGSLMIGLCAGYHFSYEIVFYLRNLSHIFEGHEHLRFLVMTAVIIGFFLSIPGMFIGAIVAAVFKHVIYDKRE